MPNPRNQVHLNLPPDLKDALMRQYHETHTEHGYPSFTAWLVAWLRLLVEEKPQ